MNKNLNTRELITDILLEYEKEGGFMNLLLFGVLEKYDYLSSADKAFIKRIVEGTLENLIRIDYIIDKYSNTPTRKQKPFIRALLRHSVYQIMFLNRIPDSAVCNEAVALAKKRQFSGLSGFVNGVLRTISRNRDSIEYPNEDTNKEEYLHVYYSIPKYLVSHFVSNYGYDDTKKIFSSFLEARPVCIRFFSELADGYIEKAIKGWETQGVSVSSHPYDGKVFLLSDVPGIASLWGYREGIFTVQDVSSVLAVRSIGLRKMPSPVKVIDVCAAPGGKSMLAAELLGENGQVYSYDLSAEKVERMQENAERMHSGNMFCEVRDACEYDESLKESADVVIADVPCSGLGIIGKKQDIKYRIDEEEIENLLILQNKIIDNVTKYVKKGGILMYSTCTINPRENEKAVKNICDKYGFEAEDFSDELPDELKGSIKDNVLQLLPGIHMCDGFFMARLRKK